LCISKFDSKKQLFPRLKKRIKENEKQHNVYNNLTASKQYFKEWMFTGLSVQKFK